MTATKSLAQDDKPADQVAASRLPASLSFDHLTIADGLSEGSTLAIVQDEQGFMWFATQYGLDKYDGYQFTVFTHDPDDPTSLNDNDIRTLYLGQNHTLWVGTANGGLNRMDLTTNTFTHYLHNPDDPNSLIDNYVHAIQGDTDGNLWVGTEQGLNRIDPATGTVTRYQHDPNNPDSLSSNRVYALTLDKEGHLWAGMESGLCRFDKAVDHFECYLHKPNDPNSLSDNIVISLYSDSAGTLWVGTNQGLNTLDLATGTFTRYLHNPDDPLSISNDAVHAIYEDRDGRLWIGTRGGGLNLFNRSLSTFTSYQNDPENPNSLSGNTIFSIFQDASGILWMGTWATDLNFIAPSQHKFESIYNISNPISMQADANQLWVGTLEDGLIAIDLKTQKVRQFVHNPNEPNSLLDNAVFALYLGQGERLWAATAGGLNQYNPVTEQFDHPFAEAVAAVGLDTGAIRTMLVDSKGHLWLGTQFGLFCLNPATGTFDCYSRDANADLLNTNLTIYTLVEGPVGTLWLGTQFGLYRLNTLTNEIQPYNSNTSGVSSSIVALLPDENGTLWIGTWGTGLYHFDPSSGEITHYTRKNGLPGDLILGIEKDSQGRLWISTSSGLALFDPKNQTVRNYDQLDGLAGIDFNQGAFSQDSTGKLFFGTSKYVIGFHPEELVDNSFAPPVVLTGFQLFNKPVTIGGDSPLKQQYNFVTDVTLNYDQSVFSFEYAALNFAASARNQYAYKLDGFDADWNDVGNRRMATYTNLKPGSYTFQVKASNNDGLWNENGLIIHLTVTPPWWQTWWAYTLYAVIGVTAILGYIRYRTRTQALELARERQLRETLERVDRSKDEERSRIAREMHDGLSQTLAGLRFRLRTWSLDPSRITAEVDDTGVVLDVALQDLRRIIFALRPVMLNELGFLASVTHLAKTISKQNSIEIHTSITGDETQLPEILEHAAFRIVQESLHNVLRHAGASQVWLKVTVDARMVDIEVRDDGVGFETSILELRASQGHQGILNLRERAAAFKGSVVIESQPGQGTTLHAQIPVENQPTRVSEKTR